MIKVDLMKNQVTSRRIAYLCFLRCLGKIKSNTLWYIVAASDLGHYLRCGYAIQTSEFRSKHETTITSEYLLDSYINIAHACAMPHMWECEIQVVLVKHF